VDISLIDRVQNEEVLQRTKAERKIKRTQANCIGHIWSTKRLLKHIKRKIEGAGRRGRRRNRLLEDLMETKGYCESKKEALYRTL